MRKSSFLSLAAALLLTVSLLPLPAQAAETQLLPAVREAPAFSDTTGTEYADAAALVYEAGLMDGYTASAFGPEDPLMPQQLVAVCARLHSRLTGGSLPAPAEGEAWYEPSYRYLAAAIDYQGTYDPLAGAYLGGGDGTLTGEEQVNALRAVLNPGKSPVRQGMLAGLLGQTLEAAGVSLPQLNEIPALVNVQRQEYPGSESAAVYNLCRAGVLTVMDSYGSFDLYGQATRGQFAAILARVLDPALRTAYTVEPFDLCADVLGLEGETIALTVDGQTVTVEEMAQELCLALRQNALENPENPDPQLALTIAVAEICEDLAIDRVAAERQLTVTEETILSAYGELPAGYEGVSRNGWLWEYRHELLHQELYRIYYLEICGQAPAEESLPCNEEVDAALGEALATVRPEADQAVLAPALADLDWDAVLERLLDSPFADL